jgi:hypothetical protein
MLQDLEQREAVRAAAAKDAQWQAFIDASRPHVSKQVGAMRPSERVLLQTQLGTK